MSLQDAVLEYGGVNKAADALGIARTTFRDRLKKEHNSRETVRHEKLETPKLEAPSKSGMTRILYFTDAHNQPCLPLDRFKWLARLVNDQKPDVIVDGGDGDDFHSLCSHERNETYKGRLKPLLGADLESAAKMRAILHREIKHPCRKVLTLGNHEHRIWSYEDNNPAMYGIVSNMYTEILRSTGWEYHPYGAYVEIAGINFTHVPFNVMGKPVGGENICKQIADKSTKDICFGHTHQEMKVPSHKFGNAVSVIAFNGGCFMPSGYIPNYSKNTKKEFWYGCHLIVAARGRILSTKSWHMDELEMMYGGAD